MEKEGVVRNHYCESGLVGGFCAGAGAQVQWDGREPKHNV